MTLSPLRGLSRRGLLTAAAGSALGLTGCSSAVAQRDASVDRVAYGQDPSQFGELYLPARIPLATVVVIHGGYWVDGFVAEAMQPMCRALQADGYAVWNLEYRRIGGGGGWPATFEDVATGIDHLTTFDTVDTSDVRLVGHSAGGTLAVWAASRRDTTPGGPSAVTVTRCVSLAGVLDLTEASRLGLGGGQRRPADGRHAGPGAGELRPGRPDPARPGRLRGGLRRSAPTTRSSPASSPRRTSPRPRRPGRRPRSTRSPETTRP